MKALGWILFLLAAALWLLFYNLSYLPLQGRVLSQQDEIGMWTEQVQNLSDRLERIEAVPETLFFTAHTFDQLFAGPDRLALSKEGERLVQECVPKLKLAEGLIEVTGHTDNLGVPTALANRCASDWEYGAAKASVVVRALKAWGIQPQRLEVRSAGDAKPRADTLTAEGRGQNARVEILVRRPKSERR